MNIFNFVLKSSLIFEPIFDLFMFSNSQKPFKEQNSLIFLFFEIIYISVMGESILKLFKTFLHRIYLLVKILFDKQNKLLISLILFFILVA